MKKNLLFLLMITFIGLQVNAQKVVPGVAQLCTCNPNGWQPVTAIINNTSQAVQCGYQFSLKCNDVVTLRTSYKCTGNCNATYTAVLKNAAGTVIQTLSPFSFPWNYHFTVAGNYSLEITPFCGNNKCTPCRFYFTVTCTPPPTACDCDPNGWKPFTAIVNNTKTRVSCGYQFAFKHGIFKLEGAYKCKGNCNVKYTAVLINATTGAVVQEFPTFNFTWTYNFATIGNFKLQITPICGDKKCPPCIFYFTIS